MRNIMGRESPNPQCWECANCELPKVREGGSRFFCTFLEREFGTWHYDVPDECPCKGRGWWAQTPYEAQAQEGGAK